MLWYFGVLICPTDTHSSLGIRVRCFVAERRDIPVSLLPEPLCCKTKFRLFNILLWVHNHSPYCLTQHLPGWCFISLSRRKFLWPGRFLMRCWLLGAQLPVQLAKVQRHGHSKSTNGEWRAALYPSGCKISSFGPMLLRFCALTDLYFLLEALA